ncbi:MAG: spore coat protein [Bacillota bacterium]
MTMRMGIHEAVDMHEFLTAKVCKIEHHALYAAQADDPQLKSILERHKDRMIQDYNAALNLMQGRGMPVDPYHARNVQSVRYGTQQTERPIVPHPDTSRLSDRTIATGALIAHKCGAVGAMRAALETADPDLRQFLTHAAVSDSNMAYEIFQWMNQKGFYQVPVMDINTMQHIQHIYSPTTAPGGGMAGPQGTFV